MKKVLTVALTLFAVTGLLIGTVSNVKAQGKAEENVSDDRISVINWSLKPVMYVGGDKFLQTKWNLELKNNESVPHSFTIKIVFFDKEKDELKQVTKDADINGSESKKYSDVILLDPDMAKKVATTKAFIENVR